MTTSGPARHATVGRHLAGRTDTTEVAPTPRPMRRADPSAATALIADAGLMALADPAASAAAPGPRLTAAPGPRLTTDTAHRSRRRGHAPAHPQPLLHETAHEDLRIPLPDGTLSYARVRRPITDEPHRRSRGTPRTA
ncbi:hypothetical protein ACWCPM_19465 [Streptomyces sp. NPDC002309]